MSEHTAAATQWLESLLSLSGFEAKVEVAQPDNFNFWLTIDQTTLTPAQVELLIGTDGATLDAIQYLANATFGRDEQQHGFTVELDSYRQRRSLVLKSLADRAAEQVRQSGAEYEMPPLSGADRRQLHNFFELEPDYRDLATYSRGLESDRRLVVKLADRPTSPYPNVPSEL
jgi:spoIIIJ-associated protein